MYEIGYQLRLPIYVLKSEMPYDELQKWIAYFDHRPVGWRDDQRFLQIMRAIGVKESAEKLFPSLGRLSAPEEELKEGQMSMAKFNQSAFFSSTGIGGDSLDL